MRTHELDYELPENAIAQQPAEPRDSSRLLVDLGAEAGFEDRTTRELPELLVSDDVLVVNNSRVMPARLRLRKTSGGQVEVLLLEPSTDGRWSALVRPGRRVPPRTQLCYENKPVLEVGVPVGDCGRRWVQLMVDPDVLMAQAGEVPLPPYVTTELADKERYQTVYSKRPVSTAAPTAGLHLTNAVLDRCRARGVQVCELELAVGSGTFTSVATENLSDHEMHSERYLIPQATLTACKHANRVVAVGTTVVRALEAAAASGLASGQTSLFIQPGYRFAMVDALLTNFHLPRSSLLALMAAFMGARWRDAYVTALARGYRFLSLGDAMFCARSSDSEHLGDLEQWDLEQLEPQR
ncbi:MAG: tRNA preQ1(34) S-adenosylmethionine ribosyltransferase-isomerase QueA [Acidimicrobiia bacterium]|nr:tRNA preQ1(34) S-adenosylmethionine ribosyltransferase-isomerase QueA [Acidimicrobiia bacterium]MYC57312.1 tRNA preQ1(34) S-adenosylmethionine ribosyltransferase-isomerase QueA [Acidimicrobiia bacterium]MYG94515.1 tRNA preQ1(34) S-adenosylmethionine ribosyltransferase-isomerase QueA [Acidimicrobiia bacterium]MYI31013.1 tRNA preQ1(34) S-adenosylmethionine ribosyltransferase-isomerase QueA [Acidimicrobiia bacterium]